MGGVEMIPLYRTTLQTLWWKRMQLRPADSQRIMSLGPGEPHVAKNAPAQ